MIFQKNQVLFKWSKFAQAVMIVLPSLETDFGLISFKL